MKPGCFGSIVTYDPQGARCQSCALRAECAGIALEVGSKIVLEGAPVQALIDRANKSHRREGFAPMRPESSGELGAVHVPEIRAAGQMPLRFDYKLTIEEERLISSLPVKAQREARAILRRGIDVIGDLSQSKNPFEGEGPKFMRIACALLIGNGGFRQAELNQALIQQGMTENSAKSSASIACALLRFFGIKQKNGIYLR
ncbi:hypothetical protein [Chitinibacter tainanensis]|uniref:hypothetical protein n=1 Tax=Chitinibacter tainanensis TaxID=230667 RepID=UPI00048E1BBD|nr:hypothetical protein [Chitinibacter tainanensis]